MAKGKRPRPIDERAEDFKTRLVDLLADMKSACATEDMNSTELEYLNTAANEVGTALDTLAQEF